VGGGVGLNGRYLHLSRYPVSLSIYLYLSVPIYLQKTGGATGTPGRGGAGRIYTDIDLLPIHISLPSISIPIFYLSLYLLYLCLVLIYLYIDTPVVQRGHLGGAEHREGGGGNPYIYLDLLHLYRYSIDLYVL